MLRDKLMKKLMIMIIKIMYLKFRLLNIKFSILVIKPYLHKNYYQNIINLHNQLVIIKTKY